MISSGRPDADAVRGGPGDGPDTLQLFLREMRVRQWSKSLVLFAALIFSKNLLHPPMLARSAVAFLVFCLLSGVVYTVNDLLDLDADRRHEVKRRRPLASGRLPVSTASAGIALVLGVALAGAALLSLRFLLISIGFLAFNLAYSLVLKNIVIVDVISISISFLTRAIAGVIALNTATQQLSISPWLLVVTFFLSLFLGLCKRLHEYRSLREAGLHRSTLSRLLRGALEPADQRSEAPRAKILSPRTVEISGWTKTQQRAAHSPWKYPLNL